MPDQAPAISGRTLPDLLVLRAEATPNGIAFRVRDAGDGTLHTIAWSVYQRSVQSTANALAKFGLHAGDRIGILAPTSVRWEIAQMGALTLGAVVVGLDPAYSDEQLFAMIDGLGLKALFVHDDAMLSRVATMTANSATFLCRLYGATGKGTATVIAFDDLLKAAGQASDNARATAQPSDGAIIVFSSGTTGHPKPIQYTHEQVIVAVEAILDAYRDLTEDTRLLCWLPLANLFQRIINFCAIARGASSYMIADPRQVMDRIQEAAPHLFIGVPRFFERVHRGINERIEQAAFPLAALSRWGLALGGRYARSTRTGTRLRLADRLLHPLADRLVAKRLRRVFGGRARYLISGSAPMPLWLLEFFDAIGLPVYEAYGISEDIVPVAMNRPGGTKLGTVGRPLPANDVALTLDGEILVRGPGVFAGYLAPDHSMRQPDTNGFWATGDQGTLDAEGFLTITGRRLDSFKISTGRWVAPVEIEQELQRIPYVDYALVFGAGRKAIIALLGIEAAKLTAVDDSATGSERYERRHRLIRADVAAATSDLPAHHRPAALVITTRQLSISASELTTNLKPRRKVIESRYADALNLLYAALDSPPADVAPDWLPVIET